MMEFNTKGTCKQFHNKREQIEQYYGTNAQNASTKGTTMKNKAFPVVS